MLDALIPIFGIGMTACIAVGGYMIKSLNNLCERVATIEENIRINHD
jgi:hypothetical protein